MNKPGASMGKNTHYRIRFFMVKGFPKKNYLDATADKATHYQVFQNNKELGEFKTLKAAIDLLRSLEGQNKELDNLIENIYYIQNPTANFITAGITYTQKHGVRIEQVLRE
jgi:hypothetical protein